MREYTYQVDEDGVIWHDGAPFDDPELYEIFHRSMTRAADGRVYATCQGERCWIDAADTPFVVEMVRMQPNGGQEEIAEVTLILKGGVEERLDPATLRVGARNVLYTTVREGAFPARFSRKAYYELARHVTQDGNRFTLRVGGRAFPILQA